MTIASHLRNRALARRRQRLAWGWRTPLELYLDAARLRRQARAWLAGDDADRVAAHCMFHLNRAAWANDKFQPFYRAKNHLVRVFYQKGMCRSVRLHAQTKNCWECCGSGNDGHGPGTCWKCGGTGIYRQHVLVLFRFDVNGRFYSWHQPKDLGTCPVRPDFVPVTEYEPRPSHQRFSLGMPLPILELYAVTVNEYLVREGVAREDLPAYGPRSLLQALRSTWRLSKASRRLARFRRKVKKARANAVRILGNARRIGDFLSTGELPAPSSAGAACQDVEDELPF